MKVLVDMNLSPEWVQFLGEAGHQAIHWSKIGMPGAADAELMHWALENGYVVLTADLDFGAILAATNRTGPSVILVRSDNLAPRVIGDVISLTLGQAQQQLLDGALVSVDATRARLRILPLK
ncbi:MAG TPA: DUF5615 family PIN-like protein [Pseudolabrys sp.]|jgi:predicted nuclease of predicted toxin-antitoxin system|nr:DUF5615 family PIN-like protein [Pseudolabrys sp.]